MRSAAILGQANIPKVRGLTHVKECARSLAGLVEICSPQCVPLFDGEYLCDLYATLWVGPHKDEVIGDVTLGIVIAGDHYLFTGNGRRVGDLVPGTVFALLNKRLHGAYARDMKKPKPLIFAACEPKVSAEDWRGFCADVVKNLKEKENG